MFKNKAKTMVLAESKISVKDKRALMTDFAKCKKAKLPNSVEFKVRSLPSAKSS